MGLKRRISYQWRYFLPTVLALWSVIIGMALWQVHRVRQIKKEMVNDQLTLVGESLAYFFENDRYKQAEAFMTFINKFYLNSRSYEPMSIQVRDADGKVIYNVGDIINEEFTLPLEPSHGYYKVKAVDLRGKDEVKDKPYVYHVTPTRDGHYVYVMLPYTRAIAQVVSEGTSRFWMVLFSVAVFVTIFLYITASFFNRNIRILRQFASKAAENPEFLGINTDAFPHDELGDISREIMSIYKQRVEEMERREREHKVAMNAIKEKDRIKRELTGNINHELKTPVGVIQGYIDTLVDNPDMDIETRDRFLYKAQQGVHRLTALIKDITAITRLESDGKLVNVTDVDFHDLVFTFDSMLSDTPEILGGLKFNYDVPLNLHILGNESLLQSVLLNLVKNAAAYSKGTYCRLEYEGEDDRFYKFTFYDDGMGVPPEHLPHMFERFYRVNSGRSRESGGTGLGLALVDVTIRSFGGSIDVGNRYPSGLQYHFTLQKYTSQRAKQSQQPD